MNKTPTIDKGTNVKKSTSFNSEIKTLVTAGVLATLVSCGGNGNSVSAIDSVDTSPNTIGQDTSVSNGVNSGGIGESSNKNGVPTTRKQEADFFNIDKKNSNGIGKKSAAQGVPTTRQQEADFFRVN